MSDTGVHDPVDGPVALDETRALGSLDPDERLDDLATRSPLLRAILVADCLARRPLPEELLDAVDTVGELRSWLDDDSFPGRAGDRAGGAASSPANGATDQPDQGWPVTSPRAMLRPVGPADLGAIHAAFNDPASAWRLPSRGRTVLPSAVERVLDGADLQLVGAVRARPDVGVTLMALNRFDPVNRTADLTIVGLARTDMERGGYRPPRGIRFETVAMFVSHAFVTLDLFKITAAIPSYNWPYFAAGVGRFFVEEGCLHDQVVLGARRFDVHHVAMFRDRWTAVDAELAAAFGGVVIPDRR